jgi:tRNA/rRNA methyltransferase
VSFPLKSVIDLLPPDESAAAAALRAKKIAWLGEREYRVIEITELEIAADLPAVLDRLARAVSR